MVYINSQYNGVGAGFSSALLSSPMYQSITNILKHVNKCKIDISNTRHTFKNDFQIYGLFWIHDRQLVVAGSLECHNRVFLILLILLILLIGPDAQRKGELFRKLGDRFLNIRANSGGNLYGFSHEFENKGTVGLFKNLIYWFNFFLHGGIIHGETGVCQKINL